LQPCAGKRIFLKDQIAIAGYYLDGVDDPIGINVKLSMPYDCWINLVAIFFSIDFYNRRVRAAAISFYNTKPVK
jgi:hypothetical protein